MDSSGQHTGSAAQPPLNNEMRERHGAYAGGNGHPSYQPSNDTRNDALAQQPYSKEVDESDMHGSPVYKNEASGLYGDPSAPAKYLGMSGVSLNLMIAFAAGVGFVLFGYDQGVMGSLLTLKQFGYQFPSIYTPLDGANSAGPRSIMQGATIGIYEIGCFIGSIICLLFGNLAGRRKMIWIGSILMAIGATIQAGATNQTGYLAEPINGDRPGMAMLWVGRVIAGIGNGMHTATIPVWQSECSPPHRRGMLIMIEGSLISFGIMISYWIDYAFYWFEVYHPTSQHVSVAWRFPIAFQIVLIIPTFLTIFLPESPRWLMLKGREREARHVLAALDEVPENDPIVDLKVDEIKEGLAVTHGVGLRDLFRQGRGHYFHRTALAFVIQMFQQISGINLITYYAGTIFEQQLNFSPAKSRVLAACNGTEYFLASIIAIFTVERFGRRPLMIFGAAGMAVTMGILAGTLSDACKANCVGRNGLSGAVVGTVMLFVFNTFFAIGWLGMTWLYPAECTPLTIRAAANGISTSANWLFNFMVVMITPIAFYHIHANTFIIFAAINALMVPASWWIFPETAGRSLEEMDLIFAQSSKWNPYDAVRKEKRFPRRYDRTGNVKAEVHLDDNLNAVEHQPEFARQADV